MEPYRPHFFVPKEGEEYKFSFRPTDGLVFRGREENRQKWEKLSLHERKFYHEMDGQAFVGHASFELYLNLTKEQESVVREKAANGLKEWCSKIASVKVREDILSKLETGSFFDDGGNAEECLDFCYSVVGMYVKGHALSRENWFTNRVHRARYIVMEEFRALLSK
jgi:hypothetical protein